MNLSDPILKNNTIESFNLFIDGMQKQGYLPSVEKNDLILYISKRIAQTGYYKGNKVEEALVAAIKAKLQTEEEKELNIPESMKKYIDSITKSMEEEQSDNEVTPTILIDDEVEVTE